MTDQITKAQDLHENVPPNWYFDSIRRNLGQRYWHTRRFGEVEKLIEPTQGKILDIGCADGVFTKVILDRSKADQIIGIDVLPTSISWAKNHWKKNHKMSFGVGDAHNLKYEANTFNAVFALEVLEHVFDPEKVLREVKMVLKKDGYAIFLVPTDSYLFRTIWFFWTKFWRGKVWDNTHIQSFYKGTLLDIARKVGFKIEVDKKFLLGMLQVIKVRKI